MRSVAELQATPRVKALREYYLTQSPMAQNSELACWKCHRSLLLYVEGWKKALNRADTVRLRRSMAEAYVLEHTVPVILPGELIVGQPDFTPFTPEEEEAYRLCLAEERLMPKKAGRADHLALDYTLLLERGTDGMLEILEEELKALDPACGGDAARYEFLLCCQTELLGLNRMCDAYRDRALELAAAAQGKEKEEYGALAEVLGRVPRRSARSFREALQSIHTFTWSLYGLYSFGKPDLYLLPYYRRDLAEGRLTAEEAQELIDCFYLLSVPNMPSWGAEGLMLGGRDREGRAVENELTRHFLTAVEHTRLPDPNVGFCVTEETGEEILRYVADLIGGGCCQPQIWNCDEVIRSLISRGVAAEDARLFTLSTCAEITPIGCSGVSITSPYINLLQILLDSLRAGKEWETFDGLFEHFTDCLREYCKKAILRENLQQLERGRNSTDPMRISLLIRDCLGRGKSNDEGGAVYNFLEPNLLGMQNVTESLNVLKTLVYDEKSLTLAEFVSILDRDYEGAEELLLRIRNKIPHFGSGTPETNALAKGVADGILEVFSSMTTVRGAAVIPGAFSYREHELQGRKTGASPDGRRAGMPLNDGSNPVQGYDRQGPTLSLAATASWEPSRFLGGTVVNVKLCKNVKNGQIVALIRGYLKTHGAQLQFNVVDGEALRDAQLHPERHRDLLVRIGGYSDFFVKIPNSLQDEIISRTENRMN